MSIRIQLSISVADCGTDYKIENGHVSFKGLLTTYHQRVPVTCNTGYDLIGEAMITCLASGRWSDDTKCLPKGMFNRFMTASLFLPHQMDKSIFH